MLPILQHIWSGRCFYLAGQKHANAPVYGTKTLAGFAEEGDPLQWHWGCKRSSAALLKIDFSLHQLILKCFKRRDSLGAEIKARRGAGAGFNASSLLALRSCTFCLFHLFWDLPWKRQWETSALRAREGNSSQGKEGRIALFASAPLLPPENALASRCQHRFCAFTTNE